MTFSTKKLNLSKKICSFLENHQFWKLFFTLLYTIILLYYFTISWNTPRSPTHPTPIPGVVTPPNPMIDAYGTTDDWMDVEATELYAFGFDVSFLNWTLQEDGPGLLSTSLNSIRINALTQPLWMRENSTPGTKRQARTWPYNKIPEMWRSTGQSWFIVTLYEIRPVSACTMHMATFRQPQTENVHCRISWDCRDWWTDHIAGQ